MIRATASRDTPVTRPRASQGAIRAREDCRNRLNFPDVLAVKTYSLPSSAVNQTGVFTSAPLRRNVERLR
jgi:hypothetical protein